MIKSIQVDYPDYNLKIEKKFKKWINIIEEENWYWKTVLAKTIISAYSKSFLWERTLPTWTAKITTDSWDMLMSKSMWVWSPEKDDLYKYILPWEFMKLSTPDQRKVIVWLLNIDRDAFIKEKFLLQLKARDIEPCEYSDKLKKQLTDEIKEAKWQEKLLLEDITRLQWQVNSFEEKTFDDIKAHQDYLNEIEAAWSVHNKTYQDNILAYNKTKNEKNNIRNNLINEWNQLQSQLSWTCSSCNQKIPMTDEKVKEINDKLEANKIQGTQIAKELSELVDPQLPTFTSIDQKAIFLKIDLVPEPTPERLKEAEEYIDTFRNLEFNKTELERKKQQLRDVKELDKQSIIDSIDEAHRLFTEELSTKTDSLWLELDLFKTQVNWKVVETFKVSLDWTEYKQLSMWNKMILEVQIALMFIKELNLDFIIIDEGWILWQVSFDKIKELCSWLQVLIFRANYFKNKK